MPTTAARQPKKQSAADRMLLAVEAEECRRSLSAFKRAVWPIIEPAPYVDGWCQDALDVHLEAVARGAIRKLVINIPPGHTKSTELVIWRAWLWTQSPAIQILAASFSLALSLRDNLKVRRILEDPWFVARYGHEVQMLDATVALAEDDNAKTHFATTASGFQHAVSVAASTTGLHANYLIIDDPHNADEAHSAADRQRAVLWYREVWSNRVNDPKVDRMVTVGQRIHEEDVCGYILRNTPGVEHLCLPAEYEPARKCVTSIGWSDPRSQEGALLWPERFGPAEIAAFKRGHGAQGYAAQYQQSPVAATGGQFKREWFRYFETRGDYYLLHTKAGTTKAVARAACRLKAVNDVAISSKQDADYTVLQVHAVTPDNETLLVAQVRAHLDNPEQLRLLENQYRRFVFDDVHVETVAYQLALYQQAKALGIPVQEYRPARDKVARASMAAIRMEAGDTYFEQGADYLADLESELLTFPKGAHDDQVDCLSMIADLVAMPVGPLMWSPDSVLPSDPPPSSSAPAAASRMVQIDDTRETPWDYGEGDMIDMTWGGQY